MTATAWIRQGHRWLSILFTVIVAALFVALGTGHKPPSWSYFTPLPPLALLAATGLWLFVLPYARALPSRARRGR